jgi:hypothetical protein
MADYKAIILNHLNFQNFHHFMFCPKSDAYQSDYTTPSLKHFSQDIILAFHGLGCHVMSAKQITTTCLSLA